MANSSKPSDVLSMRFAAALPAAVGEVEARMLKRGGTTVREEDLRSGLADALRASGELVLTEARLAVAGWTEKLGGFDLAIVDNNHLAVAETKWSDGNLYEAMWDILKLASATTAPRVRAGVAFYAAPTKQWQRADFCTQLFEDRVLSGYELILAFPKRWVTNLSGSSVRPMAVPARIELAVLATETVQITGHQHELRVLSVLGHEPTCPLTNGWPEGAPPEEGTPLR